MKKKNTKGLFFVLSHGSPLNFPFPCNFTLIFHQKLHKMPKVMLVKSLHNKTLNKGNFFVTPTIATTTNSVQA